MTDDSIDPIKPRLIQAAFGLGFLLVVILAIKLLMGGNFGRLGLIAGLGAGIGLVLALDKHYWLLCPILFVCDVRIPSLPFSGQELGCLIVIFVAFVRGALHKDRTAPLPSIVWLASPYFAWVAIVWSMNPTGFAFLGSSSIGARFYLDIVLGFLTLLTISKTIPTEHECKCLFFALVVAHFIQTGINYYILIHDTDVAWGEELVSGTHTNYFLDTLGYVVLLILCAIPLSRLIRRPWIVLASLILFALTVYSGRRTRTGYILLAPFLLVLLRGREKMVTFICATIAAILLGIGIAGHGSLYQLPYSVQRGISFLPGKWDRSLENYGTRDFFRAEMRRRAREVIKQNPWIGRGGMAMNREDTIWMSGGAFRYTGESGMAYSGNWHNKFYGMSADFGLPAGFSWYLFAIGAFLYLYRHRQVMVGNDYRSALLLFYSLMMCYDLIFVMGGSASTPLTRWPQFGFLLALLNNPESNCRFREFQSA